MHRQFSRHFGDILAPKFGDIIAPNFVAYFHKDSLSERQLSAGSVLVNYESIYQLISCMFSVYSFQFSVNISPHVIISYIS